MPNNQQKEREEASLVGKILSLEGMILLMGLVMLGNGIFNNDQASIFFAVVIIPGVFLLRKVRRKDWKKHWAEMEAEQKARQAYRDRNRSDSAGDGQ